MIVTNTKRIRAVVVDDEELARERIKQVLADDRDVEVVAECGTGAEAVEQVLRYRPDLLFLDVQMPGLDGIGVIKKLSAQHLPLIVFVSAYDEYAVQAFELHACDYVLKPFKKKRFQETLAHIKNQLELRNGSEYTRQIAGLIESLNRPYLQRIGVKEGERLFFVKTDEIEWFEAEDNYVRIHHRSDSYLIRQTMRSLEEQLDPCKFARIHRTAIINVEKIRELQQWFQRDYRVILQDGTKIPLGRKYRRQLRELLGAPI